jgi:membrane-bound lytic murein transglycosylase A
MSLRRRPGLVLALAPGAAMARQATFWSSRTWRAGPGQPCPRAAGVSRHLRRPDGGRLGGAVPAGAGIRVPAAGARASSRRSFRPVLIEDGHARCCSPATTSPSLRRARAGGTLPTCRLCAAARGAARGALAHSGADRGGALAGRGLEIAWLDDPVEAFFLQVQGRGGCGCRRERDAAGLCGGNGHPYTRSGRRWWRAGRWSRTTLSMQRSAWVAANPVEGAALLRTNASFRVLPRGVGGAAGTGPLGAMNRSVTALRSLAVDPRFVPLGAPGLDRAGGRGAAAAADGGAGHGRRDQGAQRADIFFGTGARAGERAGQRAGRRADGGAPARSSGLCAVPETVARRPAG